MLKIRVTVLAGVIAVLPTIRIHEVLKHDWENSHPLDLSEEGLLAELKDLDENVAEDLGLKPAHPHKKDKRHNTF
jgi:hypothetical protein